MADRNGVVIVMMDDDEREYRRAYHEATHERLAAERAAAEAMEAERELEMESRADQNDHLYRYGLRLADPYALERHRAEQLELKRARQQERAADEAREAEILRARQHAAEPTGFSQLQVDVIGCVISEERKRERAERKAAHDERRAEFAEQLEQLRAELTGKAHTRGQILDLPALPVVRRSSDAA